MSLPPPAVASTRARSAFFLVQGSHPLLGRPFSRTPFSLTHTHARARTHARTGTTDDERRYVRSAGVADWKTARGGNTERTLTA